MKLENIKQELNIIKDFYEHLVVTKQEAPAIEYSFFKRRLNIDELMSSLSSFEKTSQSLLEKARFADKQIWETIYTIFEESVLRDAISELYTQLNTSKLRSNEIKISPCKRIISFLSNQRKNHTYQSKIADSPTSFSTIPGVKVLSSLHRLISLVEILQKKIASFDDKNRRDIDKELLIKLLNNALSELEFSKSHDPNAKISINYIQEAKLELGKKTPSWKKIIGAITVAATITAGVAVYPDATKNLNSALDYLFEKVESVSIERNSPYTAYNLKKDSTQKLHPIVTLLGQNTAPNQKK